jgi:hypothetical protein
LGLPETICGLRSRPAANREAMDSQPLAITRQIHQAGVRKSQLNSIRFTLVVVPGVLVVLVGLEANVNFTGTTGRLRDLDR